MSDDELASVLGAAEMPVAGTLNELLAQFCDEFAYFERRHDILLAIARAAKAALEGKAP